MPQEKAGFFRTNRYPLVIAGIAALVALIYFQASGFDFINLDDNLYVYENPFVTNGLGSKAAYWAFTSFFAANWHPLTWLSHQFDASLFGPEAGGHHVVSILIHAANSILLFVVIKNATGAFWKSALVAAIFAVHPAHVESVAWVAERKDVLSTFFWLLSTWAYVRYANKPAERQMLWYSVLFLAVGLMAKPMLVTLPFTLLLLDYWPLRRIDNFNWTSVRPLVLEKLPYFVLATASSIVTVFAQRAGGAIQSMETFSLGERLQNAVVAYASYVAMFFYPVNLAVWYPFKRDLSLLEIFISAAVLAVITGTAIWQLRKREYLAVGWFYFLGTLIPVIGIVQVGRQALADRYTYIPYIGLSVAVVWIAGEAVERYGINKRIAAAVCVLLLATLSAVAFTQVSYWRNSETLYVRTLSVAPDNYLIENNYCNYLEKKNRFDEAAAQCSAAIADDPNLPDAYNTLGSVRLKQNKTDEAKTNFEKAVAIFPEYTLALTNLASIASNQGDIDAAVDYLDRAMESDAGGFFDPSRKRDAYFSIGAAAMKQKRYDRSAELFRKALEVSPGNMDATRNLALSLHMLGRSEDGINLLVDAIRKNPNSAEAYNSLGLIYAERNRRPEAIEQFRRAVQINPNFMQAQNNLRKAMQ
ncbi:MAG TPA: tetratricopeptide repeat protein [Pyrinomonadaceae bacterium]|nr:tetratricopeptide repeat protein [Pyrinomonadaceae bacterium]